MWYITISFKDDPDGELDVIRCDYDEPEGVVDGPFTTERQAWHDLFAEVREREEVTA